MPETYFVLVLPAVRPTHFNDKQGAVQLEGMYKMPV